MSDRLSMNRNQRRLHAKEMERLPAELTIVPRSAWSENHFDPKRAAVWKSRKYLVQAFNEPNAVTRLSVNRVTVNANGRWDDDISWDELQDIKAQCGFADCFAIEIFPARRDVVNVANMRHLWILPQPLDVGWHNNEVAA